MFMLLPLLLFMRAMLRHKTSIGHSDQYRRSHWFYRGELLALVVPATQLNSQARVSHYAAGKLSGALYKQCTLMVVIQLVRWLRMKLKIYIFLTQTQTLGERETGMRRRHSYLLILSYRLSPFEKEPPLMESICGAAVAPSSIGNLRRWASPVPGPTFGH